MNTDLLFANVSETSNYIRYGIDTKELKLDEEYQRAHYTEIESSLHNGSVGLVNVTVLRSPKLCPSLFRFVWYTIIIGTLCLLGLTGNTLSIITLQRDRGSHVANLLLQALALTDNALLLVSLLTLSVIWGALLYFNANGQMVVPYALKYVQPIGYMTKTCAIWMTVLLAINRYIVIKKPLQAQHICTVWKARLQILAVLTFSILCNIPRFFRVNIIKKTEGNVTMPKYEETSIGTGSLFHIIYTNVLYTILVIVLPLVLLVSMNVSLILELKKMRHQRIMMSSNCKSTEANITLVMCIIIVIFIGCHMPDRILQGIRSFHKVESYDSYCYLSAVCTLLIIINSSCNFLIYFFVRKRFRRLLYQILCCKNSRRPSDVTTAIVSQLGDETELSGPMTALRRLSRSLTDILFKNIDFGSKIDKNRNRARSLGTLLEVNDQHKTHRSLSSGRLLDMKVGIVENDTGFG